MQHRAGFLPSPAPLFFEELTPTAGNGECVVMVHGGAHTGACYLVTPDGRPGWAYRFVESGYRVVIPDWPGTGRSGSLPWDELNGELVCAALGALLEHLESPVTLMVHSMSGPYGFRLVARHGERVRSLVAVAPGPPGNVQPIPGVVREDDHEIEVEGPGTRWLVPKQGPLAPSEPFVQAKLLGSSTRFPRGALAAYRASLVPIPHRLIYERRNLGGSQLRVESEENFLGKRVLVLTGTDDTDHPREIDGAVVGWLAAAGAHVTYDFLGDHGIHGNGHMLMLENNSDELADRVLAWLAA